MTPAATTPAARKASTQHRRARQGARPVAPRRVSGPVGGRAATAAGARAATVPGIALPRKPAHRPRTAAVGRRIGAFILSLPDHRLLDRLIRGRWWIPVLGLMLAGIVAMQVEVLKLGASMGRSLEQSSVLSSRNAALRQSVATLGDDQRIEQLAASMGMVMPPAQAVGFLAASPGGNAGRALASIHEPSASSFLSLTPTNGEIVTATTLAAANAPAGTTGSTSTIGSTPTSSTTTSTSAASTSGATTGPVAADPTAQSSAASSTTATPTPVTPAPTSSSSTTSSSQAAPPSQTAASSTGPSTGAVGVGPPSTTIGG
ncbi:MAG TPA: hypothetical protein VFI54_08265 [Solirubrobacteraceae bacterium]|nr:hypothetical protein [Solirubrobacteraceae bacterium]